jgi:hypothetical protein
MLPSLNMKYYFIVRHIVMTCCHLNKSEQIAQEECILMQIFDVLKLFHAKY